MSNTSVKTPCMSSHSHQPLSIATNEDNMLMMARYPDKYFDLAVVDPPYGINAPNMTVGSGLGNCKISTAQKLKKGRLNSGGGKLKNIKLNTSKIDWDNSIPGDEYFKELFRISKNQIIWGGNYFDLGPSRGFIFWDKEQAFPNFSAGEFAWTSFDMPAKLFKKNNSWGAPNKIHPTEKPIALYSLILDTYAKPGDKILDTHLGSQSSRIAAYKKGFDFYGCELDPDYFKDGNARFAKEIALPIFDTPIETSTQLTLL